MMDVLVTVKGYQTVSDDTQCVEFKTLGKYGRKNGKSYIVYDENESFGVSVKTVIKVTDEKEIIMERSGSLDTRMIIAKGKRNNCFYRTPQGDMLLGFYGESIENRLNNVGGSLTAEYNIDINNGLLSKNKIEITLKEVENNVGIGS